MGTARNYTQALTRLTRWLQQHQLNDLKHLDRDTALTYLEWRGQSVGQKLLDQERQAIQLHLGIKLPVIASELQHALKSRAYTTEQVELIRQAQTDKYQLATALSLRRRIAGARVTHFTESLAPHRQHTSHLVDATVCRS